MIFLYGYLGIGLVVLAVGYGEHRLTREKESDFVRDALAALDPERNKLSNRILRNFVAPVMAGVLMVAVWPVAVYIKIQELRNKNQPAAPDLDAEREFAVRREHLGERLQVAEIERREMVHDPLGAVPELPFGHLNPAWRAFREGVADGSALWSFSATWETRWGQRELRSGYVAVNAGAPGACFLTVRKVLPEGSESEEE